MLTRRFTILFSVVLVAVSIFAVQLVLFAKEFGELCCPGEWVVHPPVITQDPPRNTNPPSYEEITFEKKEHTNAACEIDATCIPIDVTCNTARSYEVLGQANGFRVMERRSSRNLSEIRVEGTMKDHSILILASYMTGT